MTIEILQDFNDDAFTCLLYGQAGIGKTTVAARSEKPLIWNLESGLKGVPLKDLGAFATSPIGTFDEFAGMFQRFGETEKFKTAVVDSVSKLEEMMMRHICEKEGKASLADFGYGAGYAKFKALGGLFCEWVHKLKSEGKNVILIAHEKVETFQDPETDSYDRFNCSLDHRIAESIRATVDHVFYMHPEKTIKESTTGRNKSKLRNRVLIQTKATGGVVAKTRGEREQYIPVKNTDEDRAIWSEL